MTPESKNTDQYLYDDLTVIKGIGQTRQQWLRDTFNVRTFRDLAMLSIDTIEARLKAEKQIPSRSHIERWLSEAKQFADNPELMSVTKVKHITQEDAWKPFASFVVEFQEQDRPNQFEVRTRVHYIEDDQTRTWMGVDQYELCQWITQQLGDKAKPIAVQAATEVKNPVEKNLSTPESKTTEFEGETPNLDITTTPTFIQAEPEAMSRIIGKPIFSDRLQRMIAKTTQGRDFTVQTIATPPPTAPSQRPSSASLTIQSEAPIISSPPDPQEQAQKEYSVKLQQIIAKAQRLSSNH